jgi:ATP-binding cassette, subfamily B, bacterial PglK
MTKKITFLNNLSLILKYNEKKSIFLLVSILLINVFFETFSIGLIIPFLKSITDENFFNVIYNFTIFEFFSLSIIFELFNVDNKDKLIIFLSIIFAVFFAIRILINFFTLWYIGKFKFKLHSTLSKKLYRGYLEMPYAEHLKKNSSRILTNVTGEVDLFSGTALVIITAINDIILTVSIVSLLLFVQPFAAIKVLSYFFIIGFIFLILTDNFIKKVGQRRQEVTKQTNQNIIEGFNLIKEIKIFNKQSYFYKKFELAYQELLKIFWYRSLFPSLPRVVLELSAIIILSISLITVIKSGSNLEEFLISFTFFVAAGYRLLPSLNKLINNYQRILFAKSAGDLIFSELDLINKNKSETNISNLKFKDKINFKNISFQFTENSKKIIDNANFQIKKGLFTGIIGESGAGKSTLVKLITGLLLPSEGKIFIDDNELKTNLSAWKNKIGYVSQDLILLDEPIINNIAFGELEKDIDIDRVKKAITLAELDKLVESLDKGVFSVTGERGKLLSGGQMQRICIARALYRNPEILILDESTNSLDSENEKKIIDTLQNNLKHLTIIIISHRESTIKNCDEIFKVQNKKVFKL